MLLLALLFALYPSSLNQINEATLLMSELIATTSNLFVSFYLTTHAYHNHKKRIIVQLLCFIIYLVRVLLVGYKMNSESEEHNYFILTVSQACFAYFAVCVADTTSKTFKRVSESAFQYEEVPRTNESLAV